MPAPFISHPIYVNYCCIFIIVCDTCVTIVNKQPLSFAIWEKDSIFALSLKAGDENQYEYNILKYRRLSL